MEMICRECGTELIEGHIMSGYGSCFMPTGEEKKFITHRVSKIKCKACPKCGWMTDFRLENPEKIRK